MYWGSMRGRLICVLLFVLLISVVHCRSYTTAGTETASGEDRVELASITSLVFSATGRTVSRRGHEAPQLKCVAGSAAGFWWRPDYYPRSVECRRQGSDGGSVLWRCSADLAKELVFGDTRVICEGFDSPSDVKYVLKGSCRLEYTLNFATFQLHFAHIVYGTFVTFVVQRKLQREHCCVKRHSSV